MLIVMRPDATAQDIERVNDEILRRGWRPHVIAEVHPAPPRAKSDGFQSLDFSGFDKVMAEECAVAGALGRDVARLE